VGTPLADALAVARNETDSFELAGPLGVMAERVLEGARLADALRDHPEVFTSEEVEAIALAEEKGELPRALDALE